MKEIQGKSILVRVSARFELVRVRGAHESPTLVNYPLLSDFCHFKKKFMFACPVRKMAKLGQKLQFSHSDVIQALLGLGRTIDIFVRNLGMIVERRSFRWMSSKKCNSVKHLNLSTSRQVCSWCIYDRICVFKMTT